MSIQIDDRSTEATTTEQPTAQSLLARMRERRPAQQDDLGVRYDWSNPKGLSTRNLQLKVLKAGCFADLLILAKRDGIAPLQQLAQAHPELRDNPWLQRKLNNIRQGMTHHQRTNET